MSLWLATTGENKTKDHSSLGIAFESIEEHQGQYFVKYDPAWEGQFFAYLSLVFVENIDIAEVPQLMEAECAKWMERYPIPIFVSASDNNDDLIELETYKGNNFLRGIPGNDKPQYCWKQIGDDSFSHGPYQEAELLEIYKDRPYTTEEERRVKAESSLRGQHRFVLFYSVIWLAVALFVALVGMINELLGYIVSAYAVFKAVWHFLKFRGIIQKSKREKMKAEELQQMEHHHYHCKRNPEGFIRLRTENLKNKIKEDLQKESQELLKRRTKSEVES